MRKKPEGIFPGEGYTRKMYEATGEFRVPRAGEFFLSGAVITAYWQVTPTDHRPDAPRYWIAREVNQKRVDKIREHAMELFTAVEAARKWAGTPGDHGGNPYLFDFVRKAQQVLAKIHPRVGVGECSFCGHYGEDCTGEN